MTTTCAGITDEDFPAWGIEVAAAIRAEDDKRLWDAVTRIRCGHDALSALLVLSQVAAHETRDSIRRVMGDVKIAVAFPRNLDRATAPAQIAMQIVAAALNNDADNASALALIVAEPILAAKSEDELTSPFKHFADVLQEVLSTIRDAQRDEGNFIRPTLVDDPKRAGL